MEPNRYHTPVSSDDDDEEIAVRRSGAGRLQLIVTKLKPDDPLPEATGGAPGGALGLGARLIDGRDSIAFAMQMGGAGV